MAVDKEAICLSRVYSYYPKCNFPLSGLTPEPGKSTLNVLNYKYKYFPPQKYLSTSTFLFREMYLSTFRVLSKCTFSTIRSTFQLPSNFVYPENQTKFLP